MRPLSIDVQGFTCFRDAQPTLDLSTLSLFAITGPTGAGKSSVLDAITFALYGRVPRMNGASVKDLISHGRDRMVVTLRFAARDRTFLVTRVVRRSATAGSCQLDEIVDGLATPVACGAREVLAAVERLIGLDYDAFTHAVILPQGEFARFLKGDPAQRRRILQELLRLTVYARMQKLAGERCREARRDLESCEQQLQAYADATPEIAAAMEEELGRLAAQQPMRCADREAARIARVEVARALQLQGEIEALRRDLETREVEAARHGARLQRLEDARRARLISGPLDAVHRAQADHGRCAAAAAAAAARLEAARAAAGEAQSRLVAEQDRLSALAPSRERISQLQALEGRLRHRDALDAECRTLSRDAEALAGEVTACTVDLRRREQQLEEARREAATAERQFAAARPDERELAAAEAAQPLARELRSAREHAPALELKVRQARTAATEAARVAAAESEAFEQARGTLARAEAQRSEATRRLAEAQDRWRAMTLRAHLHAGDACPVCTQPVATVPPVEGAPALAELLDAEHECIDACRTYAERLEAQRERHVRARAALEGAGAQVTAAGAARGELADRIARSVQLLQAQLQPYLPASAASMPEHWLLERLEELQAQRTRHELHDRRLQTAQSVCRDAEHALVLARQALDACRREHDSRVTYLRTKCGDLDALEAAIRAVSHSADPREELAALRGALLDAEAAVDAARRAAGRTDAELAAATEGDGLAAGAAAQAAAVLASASEALLDALSWHGFASAEEAREALLEERTEAQLRAACEQWTQQTAAGTARLAELERQLTGADVTESTLAEATAAEHRADEQLTALIRRQAQLETQLENMRARRLQVASLREQAAAARAAADIHARLSADLKADAFQAWLLREAFERIVLGASARLMELSGRYTLRWDDESFCVVDHDNAQEQRPADTLSGGETFLASLALALELSEQVQRAAGAVRLDSLFIDEGFGTLDAAAQDVVATAIESLQVTGRMVGIITHVRELTDRMPACVVIDKRPDGSRWSIR